MAHRPPTIGAFWIMVSDDFGSKVIETKLTLMASSPPADSKF